MKKLFENSLIRYILVGGTSFVIEIGVIFVLAKTLGLNSILSVSIAFWFGFVVSFLLQKLVTFKDGSRSVKKVLKQTIMYGSLVLLNYLFTIAFVWLFENILGLIIARTIALIITTGWNFVIYQKIIFKPEKAGTK